MTNVILSPSQKAVVDQFPHFLMDEDATEMTISGFAGSGKSFLITYLTQLSDKIQDFARMMDGGDTPRRRMWYTATTNKAAAVLEEMLDQETRTIHSLLRLRVRNNYKTGRQELVKNEHGKVHNLDWSIVFIDEASMINRELLAEIRKCQKEWTGCKVVFVGDEYQLPPVKEDICPVFDEDEHTVKLTEIQRQVAGSPIIQLSAKYRDCLDDHNLTWPEIPTDDDRIVQYDSIQDFAQKIQDVYTVGHRPSDYRILAWSNGRVREYNQWIRKLQGLPDELHRDELVVTNRPLLDWRGEKVVAQTDTVHQVREVVPAMEQGIKGHNIRVYDCGEQFFQPWDWKEASALAKQLAKDAKKTRNWEPYFEIIQQWADFRPIHASTVHKAQGSTYREVFVDLNNIGKNNNWREVARLTYVAITRASHRVHIYGELKERYNRQPIVDHMEPFKNVKSVLA